jgi:hypothetical protein
LTDANTVQAVAVFAQIAVRMYLGSNTEGKKKNKKLIEKVEKGDIQRLQLFKEKEDSAVGKLPRQCPLDLLLNVVGNQMLGRS